jgi:hypothetical protein
VPAYEQVVYEGLYDGVDLYVQGLGSHLKYEFHVRPGPIGRRSLRDGIDGRSLAGDGSLVLDLGPDWAGWRTIVPISTRRSTAAHQRCRELRLLDNRTYAFDITGPYDRARAGDRSEPGLSTYPGGSGGDWGYGVALTPAATSM